MSRNGYSCSMKECPNVSGRMPGLSFFRFPRDPERAKLWLINCKGTIENFTDNFYKNYRVCGSHFKPSMFLNGLKNRLQPHAVPVPLVDDHLSHNLLTSNDQISPNNSGEHSLDNYQTINPEEPIDQQIQIQSATRDKQIQTDDILLTYLPNLQKQVLNDKIRSLQKELRELKRQLKLQKNNSGKNINFSLDQYRNVTDRLLPPIANFVKTQIPLNPKSSKADGECSNLNISNPKMATDHVISNDIEVTQSHCIWLDCDDENQYIKEF